MNLQRMALPAPKSVLADETPAYVASLAIEIAGGGSTIDTTGTLLETLLTAIGLRRQAFHPRTGAFVAGSVKSASLSRAIDANWSAIDGFERDPLFRGVAALATAIQVIAQRGDAVSWRQTN